MCCGALVVLVESDKVAAARGPRQTSNFRETSEASLRSLGNLSLRYLARRDERIEAGGGEPLAYCAHASAHAGTVGIMPTTVDHVVSLAGRPHPAIDGQRLTRADSKHTHSEAHTQKRHRMISS